jgi:hypothetical protein
MAAIAGDTERKRTYGARLAHKQPSAIGGSGTPGWLRGAAHTECRGEVAKAQVSGTAPEDVRAELAQGVVASCMDPIFQGGMSRPTSTEDAIVFPEALSEAAVKKQRARSPEKAEQSAEAAALRAWVDATDMVDTAPTPFDEGSTLDELRRALHSGDA